MRSAGISATVVRVVWLLQEPFVRIEIGLLASGFVVGIGCWLILHKNVTATALGHEPAKNMTNYLSCLSMLADGFKIDPTTGLYSETSELEETKIEVNRTRDDSNW